MDNSVIVSLRDIVVEFDGQRILDGLNLDIHDKEFVTLLGSSGCGKTTTLRLIAGFLEPNAGQVLLKGQDITGVPPYKRPVNTVFQKYALFPHLNVFENVAFGLRLKKMDEETIRRKVRDMLEVVGLKGFERRSIGQMSGGQQQRVAIARSLVNEPESLLLDEPLGALDLKLRKEMQLELKRLQREMNITFIYVTHDQEEALTMSDTVVVMNGRKVQQIGTPEDIYNEPKNAFVADFIGDSNIVDGVMHRDFLVSFSGVQFPCVDRGFAREQSVQVVVRPEDTEQVAAATGLTPARVREALALAAARPASIDTRIANHVPAPPAPGIDHARDAALVAWCWAAINGCTATRSSTPPSTKTRTCKATTRWSKAYARSSSPRVSNW